MIVSSLGHQLKRSDLPAGAPVSSALVQGRVRRASAARVSLTA